MSENKLFDCFTFNDELDILELRFEIGYELVDVFVLVEAASTFSGRAKPLHYKLNQDRFRKWQDKIRHVVVDDMPSVEEGRWAAEIHQRNALIRGLDDAAPGDVVMVTDVDEIAHPEVLATLRGGCGELTGLEMYRTFRFANWELPPGPFAIAPRAMPFEMLDSPHDQRNHVRPSRVIRDGGRHYTMLGDITGFSAKFENYSHSEMDTESQKSLSYLTRAEQMGMDLFSRELVSVAGVADLCQTQEVLLSRRPDLFEFGTLPPRRERELFRWYARWRAHQDDSSERVRRLDREYDRRPSEVAAVAATEIAREATWTRPRGVARRIKHSLRRVA